MRIAIDIRNIGKKRTGDETVFFNLVKELAKIDTENEYFLCIDTRSEEELSEIRNRLGIEGKENFFVYPLGSGNRFLWNGWTVPQFVRRMKIDVYHTQYIIPICVPKQVKIVTHIHDVSFRVYPEMITWKDRLFLSVLIPYALRRSDAIVAVSEFTRKEIGKWYGEKVLQKVRVVQNGIVPREGLQSQDGEEEAIRAQLAIREKYHLPKEFFLYVGTLQPRKNIPLLLRAFDVFARNVPDSALVIVGNRLGHNVDAQIETTLQSMKYAERVIFPGYVPERELTFLYGMTECFVFPSLYEGFGLPVGEAISAGAPVVVSDIPPNHEIAGEDARYFAPDALDELAKLLYDVHIANKNHFLKKLAHSALPRWEDSARNLLKIYEMLDI